MRHDVVVEAKKYLKFQVEAPSLYEAQVCAINAAKQQFGTNVRILDIIDAEIVEPTATI